METITKADLAKILADEIDCKNTMAKQAVDVLFETLAEAIIDTLPSLLSRLSFQCTKSD